MEQLNISIIKYIGKILDVYNIDEVHICHCSDIIKENGLSEIESLKYKCGNLCRGGTNAISILCRKRIENAIVHQSYKNKQFGSIGCRVTTCNTYKKHQRLIKLKMCECFKPSRQSEPVTLEAYKTLLLVFARYDCKIPLDLRRYTLYQLCGSPQKYFICNSNMHSIFDVRKVKDIIRKTPNLQDCSSLKVPICPVLVTDFCSTDHNKLLRKYFKMRRYFGSTI